MIVLPTHVQLGDNAITSLPDAEMSSANTAFSGLKLLDLRNNDCKSLVFESGGLWTLTTLTSLNFSGNENLASIDDEGLGNLKALLEFDLSHTNCHNLPSSISGCSSLIKLQMTHCPRLVALPESLGALGASLKTLSVGHCGLRSLPRSIGGLSSLTTLDVNHNRIVDKLPDGLSSLERLVELNVSSNRIAHCPAIPRSPALLRLFLGHNRFVSVSGPEILLAAPNVQELLLNNNLIGG